MSSESSIQTDTAIAIAESLLQNISQHPGFNDIQTLVFRRSWEGQTYQQIADHAGYEHDYIKQVGSQLWRSLSHATGESVSKTNIKSVLRRFQSVQPLPATVLPQAINSGLTVSNRISSVEGQEIRWVGRESLVSELAHILLGDCRVMALVGITGIGKSSLAMRLSLEPSIAQTRTQIKVIRCDRQENVFEQMARQLLGDPIIQSDAVQKSPKHLVYALVRHLEHNQILIILDMVEEILTLNERGGHEYSESRFNLFFEEIAKTDQMGSKFILTSQQQPPIIAQGRYNCRFHVERLSGLTNTEAIQLFSLWDAPPSDERDRHSLDRFAKAYEGHPLALQVIAGEIRAQPYRGNIQAYWNDYGTEIERLEAELEDAKSQKGNGSKNLSSYSLNLVDLVEQRVNQSLRRLQTTQPLAYMLLCMSSVFRRSIEREAWLFMIGDAPDSDRLLAFQTLQRRFLVEEDLVNNRILYRLHSLIRSVASQHLDQLENAG